MSYQAFQFDEGRSWNTILVQTFPAMTFFLQRFLIQMFLKGLFLYIMKCFNSESCQNIRSQFRSQSLSSRLESCPELQYSDVDHVELCTFSCIPSRVLLLFKVNGIRPFFLLLLLLGKINEGLLKSG